MYRHREEAAAGAPEIRIGEELKALTAADVRAIEIHAVSNDNQRFFIRVGLGKLRPGTPVHLGIEGRWLQGGLGTTATDSQAIFEVDRAAAMAIAAACSVVVDERSPLDTGLRRVWRFPDEVLSGRPAQVTLQIANEGTTALVLDYCPYWLHVEATRDGLPVKIKIRMYSGPRAIGRMAPGASVELRAELRDVMSLDEPGRYQITARFEGRLTRDGLPRMDARRKDAAWDVCWTERGVVLVG